MKQSRKRNEPDDEEMNAPWTATEALELWKYFGSRRYHRQEYTGDCGVLATWALGSDNLVRRHQSTPLHHRAFQRDLPCASRYRDLMCRWLRISTLWRVLKLELGESR